MKVANILLYNVIIILKILLLVNLWYISIFCLLCCVLGNFIFISILFPALQLQKNFGNSINEKGWPYIKLKMWKHMGAVAIDQNSMTIWKKFIKLSLTLKKNCFWHFPDQWQVGNPVRALHSTPVDITAWMLKLN